MMDLNEEMVDVGAVAGLADILSDSLCLFVYLLFLEVLSELLALDL